MRKETWFDSTSAAGGDAAEMSELLQRASPGTEVAEAVAVELLVVNMVVATTMAQSSQ